MEHEKTKALRPISKKVNDCLGGIPNGSFNFGLYFNKWFCVVDKESNGDSWKRGEQWNSCLNDLTEIVGKGGQDCCHPNIQLENLALSLALFNGQNSIRLEWPVENANTHKWVKKPKDLQGDSHWRSNSAADLLKLKHENFETAAEAHTRFGYKSLCYDAALLSPLAIGLGNEHPTEKGFLFDWNMGIPYIPASSIKGVVRLAAMVNKLNEFDDPVDPDMLGYLENIRKDDTMPQPMKDLFGTGGERNSQRGKVIFLDAYPKTLPVLKAEIMNCHYPDYLNRPERGPTEDQSPNPQRYWAVDKFDRSGKTLHFVFRMMIHPDVANDDTNLTTLEKAFLAALNDHGLGAKTAVGHGRFVIDANARASKGIVETESTALKNSRTTGAPPESETWKGATLKWEPGRVELMAEFGTKKASLKAKSVEEAKELVPDSMRKNLFDKKKPVKCSVEVESFKITKIE